MNKDIGSNISKVLVTLILALGFTIIVSGFSSCAEQESRERMAKYIQETGDE
jgi:hypothetical protein